jgi:hypothetical protein
LRKNGAAQVEESRMNINSPQRLDDIEAAAVAEIEGELQDVVRRNVTFWHKRPDAVQAGIENTNSLIQRVAGASLDEIDQVIAKLEDMRETLRSEGMRVQRELAGYADLTDSAMTSMKIIAESLAHWQHASDEADRHLPDVG